MTFAVVDAASDHAQRAMGHYFQELDARFAEGFDVGTAFADAAVGLNPPNGLFVVATRTDEIVGCGGIQFLDRDTAEIKRMWVNPQRRGLG